MSDSLTFWPNLDKSPPKLRDSSETSGVIRTGSVR
jgi:hypothetical protein